jgi:hypothetical protein
MTKHFSGKKLLGACGVAALIALGMSAANADGDRGGRIRLSDRPKTIVIDNLDTAMFTKGDPAAAAHAQEICGDCHSTDYPMTQPKLSCNGWAKEINKMGTTFRGGVPWVEDGVSYSDLNAILEYLTANYGNAGACAQADYDLIQAIKGEGGAPLLP